MNIFVLDEDPYTAGLYHCDKHVPKMCVELYQQLGSAARRHGAQDGDMPITQKGTPLKGGYHNHPCTRWVGENKANYMWAKLHADGLLDAYRIRFGKRHFCEQGIRLLANLRYFIPDGELTPFAQAMPDEFKDEDAVVAYRAYYHSKSFAKWETTGATINEITSKAIRKPFWFKN